MEMEMINMAWTGKGKYEYEHEQLELFDGLRHLWGTYVPALIFHNPWHHRISIEMQLGCPVYDNIEERESIKLWEEKDKKLLKSTKDALKKQAFDQEDERGLNYV